ncbi:MAG: ribbon-helix-helix domain-containing protein [Pseudolabrys sp.]
MATLIVKRSVVLNGAKTSVSLENKFWDGLQEIARSENLTNSALIERIAGGRRESDNLSSEIRVFVLDHFRTTNEPRKFSHGSARAVAPQAGPGRDKTKGRSEYE